MNQDILWLAISILVLATMAGLWLRRRVKLQRARSWPIVSAQVESTVVRLEGSGTQQSRYIADINYSYGLDGQKYSGHLRRSFMLHGRAHKWVERFPKDIVLSVRYDPVKPHDSVLFEDEQPIARPA